MSEAMNYQTISSKDLARLVLAEGGWSNLLKRKFSNLWIWQLFLLAEGTDLVNMLPRLLSYGVHILILFLLFSTDISASKNADPALVNFLKVLLQSPIFPWDFRMLLHQRRQWRIHWFLGLLKLVDRI
ncbi:uncharacterized protein LOC133700450 isoform X4 [Populus nigra]|nr:uncharacterized protein LOC133700450 isoform X4 [Populus nigra]